MDRCPLCHSENTTFFYEDKTRLYLNCGICALVFVPSAFHLSQDEERSIYDLHQNHPDDPGYRLFLNRLYTPMIERLEPGAKGLDFGSGPGPTLSCMFEEAGHPMALYDKFYAPDRSVFDVTYDFITATEVVEHLSQPGLVIQQLIDCLKPEGFLGIMTKMVIDQTAFSHWHYKNDPTHISFFSRETFSWLAETYHADLEYFGHDVIVLKLPDMTH